MKRFSTGALAFAAVLTCAAGFAHTSLAQTSQAQTSPPPTPAVPQTTAPAPATPAVPVPPAPAPVAPTPVAPPAASTTPPAGPPAASTSTPDESSVQTIDIKPRPAVVFAGSATWDDGYKGIMDAVAKVQAGAAAAGLAPAGRPIAAFVDTDDNGFRFEAMLPIATAPEGKPALGSGLKIGSTPSGKALKFQHRGAYEDIDTTYEAITAYLDEKGIEAQNIFAEEYLNTPKSADDSDTQVDIYVFIK